MTILWTCDPTKLPPHNGKGCVLPKQGPLFDLLAIQALLRSGELNLGDDQQCWVATDSCWGHLEDLQWTTANQVRSLLLALRPGKKREGGNFVNAQWCKGSDGGMFACDSYKVRVDETNNFRRDPAGLEYYVKFSIDESGTLCLVLLQCHLDRFRLRT